MNKQLLKFFCLLFIMQILIHVETYAILRSDYGYQGTITIEVGEQKYIPLIDAVQISLSYSTTVYPSGKWVLSNNSYNVSMISQSMTGCTIRGDKQGDNIKLTFSGDMILYDALWEYTGYYLVKVINPDIKVTSISVSPSSTSLKVGETKQLSVTVSPSNATNKSVTWSTSNSNIASVNSSGLVTAKATGTTTITCKANDGSGKQGTCSVTVTAADPIKVTGITLNYSSTSLVVGDTKQLSATISPSNATDKTVSWSSNNSNIASVDNNGKVTAKARGTAIITCKANDGSGKQATCSVTVTAIEPVTDITLNYTSWSMAVGDTKQLSATISPSNATDKSVTWTTSNTSRADVSSNGLVTAKAIGKCTITCKANDGSGIQATCSITIKEPTPTGKFTAKTVEGVDMTFYGYSDGTCDVYGKPAIDINTSGKITIPSKVSGSKVVKIGDRAFSDCKGITEVIMPNTVEEVGYKAFYGCTSLSFITGFGNLEYLGSYAFDETPWIENLPDGQIYLGKIFYKYNGEMPDNTSFSFKNGTKAVYEDAFHNCKGLVAITIPESITSIKGDAFYGCDNLASITVNDGNSTYDSRNNCNAIIKTITNTLVAGCKNTTIPSSVTAIGSCAFYSNGGITSMVIPNNIKAIGANAFYNCDNLQSLVIGKGLIGIDIGAFWYCNNLQTISIVTDNTYYDSRDNCNAIIETSKNELVVGCQTTVIPNSVKSIGTYAFYGYKNIYNLVIPNNVKKISTQSFNHLDNLKTIVIGSGVKDIGATAFYRCAKLEEIYSLIDFPFDINENTFGTTSSENYVTPYENATLYVPAGSKFNYMTCVGWGRFKNIVEFDPSTFDPSTLGIQGVTMDNDNDAPVFDLFGRKLAQPQKGINIINGKKVVVKE